MSNQTYTCSFCKEKRPIARVIEFYSFICDTTHGGNWIEEKQGHHQ